MLGLSRVCSSQQRERLLVLGIGTDMLVQTRYGLGVVIQHIRPGGEHNVQSFLVAAEIRDENLDTGPWIQSPDPLNRMREVKRTAVGKLVSIDAGYHCVFHAE